MRRKTITLISIIAVIITSLVMLIPKPAYADFNPDEYLDGGTIKDHAETSRIEITSHFQGIIDKIAEIGSVVSVIALILIGIKYMVSSLEEKAEYKEKAKPYLIGATLVFATSRIIDIISVIGQDLSSSGDTLTLGAKIISILSTVGSVISIIMLVALGIKYMAQSTAETQAELRKNMLPHVIGATLVFAASTIAGIVFNVAQGL